MIHTAAADLCSAGVLSAAAMRELAAQLLTPELILFPVRHHSPGCAWQLKRLLDQYQPSAVLVEGPRSFDALIPSLTSADARMPLAVYTYVVQARSARESAEHRRAAYYPFCDHSPELVALRAAQARNIPARFIDLDFAEQCLIEPAPDDAESESLLDERYFRRSRYLQSVASQLGCRDHEELWEHLFEVSASSRSVHDYMGDVATYCHLARLEYSNAELSAEGTLAREAEMAWHIRQALAERDKAAGPVLAVVGGFHAVALPAVLARSGERPSISRATVDDTGAALIRYSYDRLDRLNGYAAGMTSPAWQQLVWEQVIRYAKAGQATSPRIRNEAALTMLFQIASELREKSGAAIAMPTLAAAYEQCLRLARLRQRPAPVRDDVLDAVTSCFVKGDADADGALILAAAHRCLRGQATGKVPAGASTPPLVKDFMYRARRQRLKIDDSQPRNAVLDIYRRPEHRMTSRLLHGLALLAVQFGVRTAGPDFVTGSSLNRLQEQWQYSYSPATESALVEASVYGVTVPLAVASRFGAKIDEWESSGKGRDAQTAAALLAHACVLGLHDHLPRVADALRTNIASDAHFASVVAAVGTLGLLSESREPLEARDIGILPELLKAAYERAIFLGNDLPVPTGTDTSGVQALTRLRETLISHAGSVLDGDLYWALIAALHRQHVSPLIRGAAVGLLYGAGKLSEADLSTLLSGQFGGGIDPIDAVAFLRGLLSTAREAAWQQPLLLDTLDRLLQQWDETAFIAVLPELRLAFAEMTPKETDRIAESVARLHGASDLGRLVRYDISDAEIQANLELSRTLATVVTASGLSEWLQT